MITGAIAVVSGVAAIVCAMNGEWGSFAVGLVIALLALFFGILSREDDRAYNNMVSFWADGSVPGERKVKKAPKLSRKEQKEKEYVRELVHQEQQEMYEWSKQNGTKKVLERLICPKCKANTIMERTVIRADAAEIWQIKCPECRETTTIRVK